MNLLLRLALTLAPAVVSGLIFAALEDTTNGIDMGYRLTGLGVMFASTITSHVLLSIREFRSEAKERVKP